MKDTIENDALDKVLQGGNDALGLPFNDAETTKRINILP